MYQLSRLAILFKISIIATLIFFVLNFSLWSITTLAPDFLWVPKQFFGIDFVKDNYRRVQDTNRFYKNDLSESKNSLIVIIGLSSACEGLEVQELEQSTSSHFLSLCGGGRNIKEISIYTNPLIESSLTPKLVVFAISPFHLMDPVINKTTFMALLRNTSNNDLFAGWFVMKRNDIRHIINMKSLSAKTFISDWIDTKIDKSDVFWGENKRMGLPQLYTEQQWKTQLLEYGNRGYYESINYNKSRTQLIQFAKIIKSFQNKGSEIIVFLMPEHSKLYQKIPMKATQTLMTKLQLLSGNNNNTLPIINLRQAISDEGFNDISHMNKLGRKTFTPILNELIQSKTKVD